MPTTFTVFSLGLQSDIDTDTVPGGGNNLAEIADDLTGLSFGGMGNPLFEDAVTFSPGTGGFSRGSRTAYDQDNAPGKTFGSTAAPIRFLMPPQSITRQSPMLTAQPRQSQR